MPTPPPLDSPDDARSLDRYYGVGLACMALLVAAFPVYRAGEPERRAGALEAMQRENVALGRESFALHCASCHGEAGRGGRGTPTLAATEFLSGVGDEQLAWLIAGGIPGTTMPAYDLDRGGPFTDHDIHRLVTYLRSLEETATSVPGWRAGDPAPVPATPPAEPEGAASPVEEEPAQRPAEPEPAREEREQRPTEPEPTEVPIESIYAAHCAACHGPEGQGTPIAGAVRPPRPPLDRDLAALVEILARGVPGTPMPGYGPEAGGPLDAASLEALARWLQAGPGSVPDPASPSARSTDSSRDSESLQARGAGRGEIRDRRVGPTASPRLRAVGSPVTSTAPDISQRQSLLT